MKQEPDLDLLFPSRFQASRDRAAMNRQECVAVLIIGAIMVAVTLAVQWATT